ncbi:hypothetical protein TNCV_3008061 [Trichonephila clavipes]|nr:hypothetical protein TNCV_3008061 [Trichonephila clavipes]
MHLIYRLAEGNARAAEKLYYERYPQKDAPDILMFASLHQNLCEHESLRGGRGNLGDYDHKLMAGMTWVRILEPLKTDEGMMHVKSVDAHGPSF